MRATFPDTQEQAFELSTARRRAAFVAAGAALVLLPWFWVTEAVVGFEPVPPALGADDDEFIAFYVENFDLIPWSATLYVGQWVIVLVLLVSVIGAVRAKMDLEGVLAIALATGATAVYVAAEGVRLWPVLAADMSAANLEANLEPGLAQAAVASRDGLHAPASVLLGVAVLLVAWLLATSEVWGHWAMAGLAVLAGALALTSAVVGPEGFGPGLIFVLWGPVTAVLLLVGVRRSRALGGDRPR